MPKIGSRNTGVDIAMRSTKRPIVAGESHVGPQGEEPWGCEQELTEEEMVRAVYEFAAEQMESGASELRIQAALIHNGLDKESAMIVVSNLTKMRAEAVGAAGKKEMLYGALWCIGGTAVTAVTYSLASEGVPFIIAFGAIIFGGIQFFRGLVQWIRK
jgi:hypothetical protein